MGLCERKVRRLAHKGKIPGQYRKGNRWRIRATPALGELGTLGSVEGLAKAVGRSLLSNNLKRSLRDNSLNSFLLSPQVSAVMIKVNRDALEAGCEPHHLRRRLKSQVPEGEETYLDVPLAKGIKSGALIQKDIARLLEVKPEWVPLLAATLKATLTQRNQKTPRERSVGLMSLLAKVKGVSRSTLYRELADIVPKGELPLRWLRKVLSLLEKHNEAVNEARDTQEQEEVSDDDVYVNERTQGFTTPARRVKTISEDEDWK
jgi:hypothetical protein